MKKYIISRIAKNGRRQYLKRVLPRLWSDYECQALPLSEKLAASALAVLKSWEPNCPFEKIQYHPPKLP